MAKSSEISQLEDWLQILMSTYDQHPSDNLAKVINYYIDRIAHHDDFNSTSHNLCQYATMKKYWYDLH